MKVSQITLATAGLMLLASLNAFAADVKVIANASVKANAISANELKLVFLEEKNSLADGTHVEPVLDRDGPAHAIFLQDYLGRSEDDLQTYYRDLVFTGRGSMPKELHSDAEVMAYVARTRGAIGYMSMEASAEGVKTLFIGDTPSNAARILISRVEPDYPETLREHQIGGIVRLRLSISAKGNVERVELLGGNPILGDSAVLAAKRWVYNAAKSQSTIEVSIPFNAN
jgi:TonB family protein